MHEDTVKTMVEEGRAPSTEALEALWRHVADKEVDPYERMDLLRPLVFAEWPEVNGQAQEAYENMLVELPDGDPRIDEFYAEFGTGADHLCACQRRRVESH